MIKVAISGSRSITDVEWVVKNLINVFDYQFEEPVFLLLGDASGVDTIAYNWGYTNQYDMIVLKPANKYYHSLYYQGTGKLLYLARDKQLVDNCDCLVAIWDGISKGTKFTIDYAKKLNKRVIIVDYP